MTEDEMEHPVESAVVGEVTVWFCPRPCPPDADRCDHHPRHWWGIHNLTCENCVAISRWRVANGVMNAEQNSGIAPATYSQEDVDRAVDGLQKLAATLIHKEV